MGSRSANQALFKHTALPVWVEMMEGMEGGIMFKCEGPTGGVEGVLHTQDFQKSYFYVLSPAISDRTSAAAGGDMFSGV